MKIKIEERRGMSPDDVKKYDTTQLHKEFPAAECYLKPVYLPVSANNFEIK
jgi:hypothetical protein